MPHDRLDRTLESGLADLDAEGRAKGIETIIEGWVPPRDGRGPRIHLRGEGDVPFLRMNSNSYLGLSLEPEVLAAGEAASRAYGAGPGAVRFISGTWAPHRDLEQRIATFHQREAAMAFSSAYGAVLGCLVPLITRDTLVVSDALNHNCIINAIRLSATPSRHVYGHLSLSELETFLEQAKGHCRRAIIVTDGVFSMRGDHAPLARLMELARRHDPDFPDNVVVMMDDSHGVGAFGVTGRGTEEVESMASAPARADILVGTLGKAFGVNGGYVTGSDSLIAYLRETAPLYVYSNPLSPGEAAAAARAMRLVDEPKGRMKLAHLGAMTTRFKEGLLRLGLETIPGPHPIAPLVLRDSGRTKALVAVLHQRRILATGLTYPVVPKGWDSIRFQLSADHTEADVDEVLDALRAFPREDASSSPAQPPAQRRP